MSGYIPEDWAIGIIVSNLQNKGNLHDPNNPNNYRGITLLSCICKCLLQYSVIVCMYMLRILKYLAPNKQVSDIIALQLIIFLFCALLLNFTVKNIKKPLYCAFVDYSKAFDLMPRVHLWTKLLSCNINEKMLDVIRNIYSPAKSYIRNNDVNGELFSCGIGVRQGENLSPLLFALYINDLHEFLLKVFDGLHTVNKLIER